MDKERNAFGDSEELFSAWLKAAGDFWQGAFKVWGEAAGEAQSPEKEAKKQSAVLKTILATAMRTWQATVAGMADPAAAQSLFKGAGAMPDILAKLAQTSLGSFIQMQQKLFESAGGIGKTAEAYKFEDLDENIFRNWADIYEKEFKQFLNVPQLGLTRLYQEKGNRVLDRYTVFQTALAEFSRLLALPVVRSFSVLQEKIEKIAEEGELPEDSKTYYNMWIKILEGHYMTLFQSTEYISSMGHTLSSMSEFTRARDDLIADFLGTLPIPRQKEVDELYQEIYRLKKRIKALEKQE